MNSILSWLEDTVTSLPLPLLEVWGRLAFLIGLVLALAAFGGFTFRVGDRFGLGRERLSWDAKAFLAIPLTFLAILVTGYLGSFIVLVPGAQTLESLKDLMVLLCVTLFGYPALLTVPFAYGLSDLIEGVPPAFLMDWLPGYFINPACFWLAYQLFGKDPDLRKVSVWGRYLAFVSLFLFLEPMMWGYLCSDMFTPDISYRNITSALFFTTSLTWLLAPPAFLVAFPFVRRLGLFWADIPDHVQERPVGSGTPAWVSGSGTLLPKEGSTGKGWPIRIVILAPLLSMMLLLTGATAFVTLKSAQENALHLAHRLNESITCNVAFQLDAQVQRTGGKVEGEALSRLLKDLPISKHGVALVLEGNRTLASSCPQDDPIAILAVSELAKVVGTEGRKDTVQFRFHRITEKPLGRVTWLARAETTLGRKDRTILVALPESYYLARIRDANSRSAMIFTLALLLALALTAGLAAGVIGGLTRLSEVTRSLARGDLSRRVPGSRLTELNSLSRSFNNMADRLSQTIDQLRSEVGKRMEGEKALESSENLLRKTEDRAKLAVQAAKMGVWDWDVEQDRLVWDESMYDLYGIDPKDFNGAYQAWTTSLHPEDRSKALEEVQTALKGGKAFDTEFRVRWKDGQIRTLRGVAQVFRSASGRPLRMIGVNWDITERKAHETLLAQETQVLEMIASRTPLPLVLETIVRAIESISPGMTGSICGTARPPAYRRPTIKPSRDGPSGRRLALAGRRLSGEKPSS
jgi:two-component system sensor histidine kinase/response regulator